MLRIDIQNIETNKDQTANYKYEVLVTLRGGGVGTVTEGFIKSHKREDGWRALVQCVLNESKDLR